MVIYPVCSILSAVTWVYCYSPPENNCVVQVMKHTVAVFGTEDNTTTKTRLGWEKLCRRPEKEFRESLIFGLSLGRNPHTPLFCLFVTCVTPQIRWHLFTQLKENYTLLYYTKTIIKAVFIIPAELCKNVPVATHMATIYEFLKRTVWPRLKIYKETIKTSIYHWKISVVQHIRWLSSILCVVTANEVAE
jgi:hypothetical protein